MKAKLSLSTRTYACEECGLVLDRDFNASINILNEGLIIYNEKLPLDCRERINGRGGESSGCSGYPNSETIPDETSSDNQEDGVITTAVLAGTTD